MIKYINRNYLKVKRMISSNNLIKGVLTLSGGTALAQIVNIFAQPIITRIYAPEEYGMLSVFTSLLLIFRVCTLRFEIAIPIAREDEEAINLVAVSFLSLIVITIFIALMLLGSDSSLLKILNAEELESFKYFLPIGIIVQGSFLIMTEWMYRKKDFKMVSTKTIIQSIFGNLAKILFGIFQLGGMGLIAGNVIATGAGISPMIRSFIQYKRSTDAKVSLYKVKNCFMKYKAYPLFQAPSTLFLHLRNQLPILMLAPLFGNKVVGQFGLANQIIQIPMTLIGQSVMSVFFAEVASLGKEQPLAIKALSRKFLKHLVLLGLIPMIILMIFGPLLFSLVFGSEWYEAGIYARILSVYVFSNFVFSPISRVFEVFEKQFMKMFVDLSSLIVLIILFSISNILNLHQYFVISLYSLVMFSLYLITYVLANKILDQEIENKNRIK